MCCCTGQPVTLRKILNIWLCYDSVRLLLDTIIEARQFFCCEVCTLRAIPLCSTSIPAWIGTTKFIIQVKYYGSRSAIRLTGTLSVQFRCGVHIFTSGTPCLRYGIIKFSSQFCLHEFVVTYDQYLSSLFLPCVFSKMAAPMLAPCGGSRLDLSPTLFDKFWLYYGSRTQIVKGLTLSLCNLLEFFKLLIFCS